MRPDNTKNGPTPLSLMRDEKKAFERLKDIIRKYRIVMPYMLERAKVLESKISMIMENSDDSRKALAKHRLEIKKSADRKDILAGGMSALEARKEKLLARYQEMLMGRNIEGENLAIDDREALDSLKGEREKFLARISKEFDAIEKELKELDSQAKEKATELAEAEQHLSILHEKAAIIEKKIDIYQADARKQIMELNNQMSNEKRLKKEYMNLISVLKQAQDPSAWTLDLLKEAMEHREPGSKVVDLKNPLSAASGH